MGVGLSNILPQQRLLLRFVCHILACNPKAHKKILTPCFNSQMKTAFKTTTQVTTGLPEEQHDGKRLVERWRERHTQLDGLLQVLLGNVEAVVVDLAAPEDIYAHRALMENG